MNGKLIGLRVLRFSLALIALFFCIRLVIGSARFGAARMLSTVSIVQAGVEPADTAIKISPDDPEAHYTRALSLVNAQRLVEAVGELQQANRLRPHHYYQWLDLGVTLERLGNDADSAAALKESIRLAPSFAQPHWQLGNLLYGQEQYQEAFVELRLGARSSPTLFVGMLDLAWVASEGDVGGFEALVQPSSAQNHFEIARFLARQGKGADSARHIRAAGQPQDEDARVLIRETIAGLLGQGRFSEAFDVWAVNHPESAGSKGQLLNGNFVDPIAENDLGFGWQLPKLTNVAIRVDPSGPTRESQSLRIDFSGESPPGSQILYQYVLLEPNSHYFLRFSAKTEKLVSGGPPIVVAADPDSRAPKTLGESKPISPETADWTPYVFEFETQSTTSGVLIGVQRTPCAENTCPVFGKLWLSALALAKK
jgi:tetratricopeptide (TPR) repeat protein